MKIRIVVAAMAAALSLSACSTAPTRPSNVAGSIHALTGDTAKLPALDDPYLDAAWFEEELSVERAVQAALANNPRTRALLARLDASQAERVQSGLIRNPVASLMALRPEGGGRFALDYDLMQSLFDLISRSRRVAMADAAQRRAEADVLVLLAGLVQDTEAAYYRTLAAQQRTAIAGQQLALDQLAKKVLERQAQQGANSVTATLQQSATVAMREHAVQDAKAAETVALTALAGQLGLSSATSLHLPVSFPAPTLPGLTPAQAQQLAQAHRPELMAGRATIEQARAEQAIQSGALRTTDPALGPAGKRESDGMQPIGVKMQITLPIFDTGQARRDLAAANLEQSLFLDEAQRRLIPLEVESALSLAGTSLVALGHAEHHVAQQRQLVTLAERTYGQGLGEFSAPIAAQQSLLLAELQQLDAQAAVADAIVGLHRATGTAMVAEVSRR